MNIVISTAKAEHAATMISLIRASITDLCAADHSNDVASLNEWLGNKTNENMADWIADANKHMIIVKTNGKISAMGCANLNGRILMNYVDPNYRFKGASKAIMNALENYIVSLGITEASLESSKTALEFYKSCGWRVIESEGSKIEMTKQLEG